MFMYNFYMKVIYKLFTDHPKSQGESYFQHMVCAATYGFKMILSGIAVIIHSIFPFIFKTTASDCAKEINLEIEQRNKS
jgi:hypothetical protein|tara:strand:+ start:721 stop:957 length:237 start_codon:yes stop_codon:yes gene_type:complete